MNESLKLEVCGREYCVRIRIIVSVSQQIAGPVT